MPNVSYDIITISFKEREIYELILCIETKLKERINDNHYLKYPDCLQKDCNPLLSILRDVAGSINRYGTYLEMLNKVENKVKELHG